jgi:hypothetical protein
MNKKEKDRHLNVPSEANRDKHINFIADERGEIDPAEEKVKGALNDQSLSERDKEKRSRGKRTNDQ